eukprot:scaffold218276_cov29-Prasinocladus_malaysianus.AAC.1
MRCSAKPFNGADFKAPIASKVSSHVNSSMLSSLGETISKRFFGAETGKRMGECLPHTAAAS